MMNTQPEAKRLADYLDRFPMEVEHKDAAAELRRLHEVNQELLHWMRYIQEQTHIGHIHDTASAAIAKAINQ